MFKNFDELYNAVRGKTNRIVIPGANNLEVLTACLMGRRERLFFKLDFMKHALYNEIDR